MHFTFCWTGHSCMIIIWSLDSFFSNFIQQFSSLPLILYSHHCDVIRHSESIRTNHTPNPNNISHSSLPLNHHWTSMYICMYAWSFRRWFKIQHQRYTRRIHTIRPRRLVWSVVFNGSSESAMKGEILTSNLSYPLV